MTIREKYNDLKKKYNDIDQIGKFFIKFGVVACAVLIIESCAVAYLLTRPKPEVEPKEVKFEIVLDKPLVEVVKPEPEPEPVEETPAAEEVVAEPEPEPVVEKVVEESEPVVTNTSSSSFKSDGVWYDGTYRYTWYSSNAAYHYRTPEWTAGSDGIYRDSEGYVVVASSDHPIGTVISSTPFGAAKVYDTGCASGTLDVYTNF